MGVQTLASPIETAGHPYNSAALPRSLWQERPAVADKPVRRLRNVCTVYVRAVGL